MRPTRDIVRALVDHGVATLQLPVSKLMTSKIISCTPQDGVQTVRNLMNQHHIRRVLVFEGGNLIGVVSV